MQERSFHLILVHRISFQNLVLSNQTLGALAKKNTVWPNSSGVLCSINSWCSSSKSEMAASSGSNEIPCCVNPQSEKLACGSVERPGDRLLLTNMTGRIWWLVSRL